jgi:hypothetical protein
MYYEFVDGRGELGVIVMALKTGIYICAGTKGGYENASIQEPSDLRDRNSKVGKVMTP